MERWTDPDRNDRAAALTEMNESPKRWVSANIRRGAAGVPDTLPPLPGLLHAAACARRVGATTSSGRKRSRNYHQTLHTQFKKQQLLFPLMSSFELQFYSANRNLTSEQRNGHCANNL